MKELNTVVFIFRRDLRLIDNTGLNQAFNQAKTVIPCFIFDPKQIEHNDYKSNNCLQFMVESLQDLQLALQHKNSNLYFFYGDPKTIVLSLIREHNIDALFVNRDYTPFSQARDAALKKICTDNNILFHASDDVLLHKPEAIHKRDGKPYTVFTPFFRMANQLGVRNPRTLQGEFFEGSISFVDKITLEKLAKKTNANIASHGGRKRGMERLKHLSQLTQYDARKDYPALSQTSGLSAHLKFGTLSVREVYQQIETSFSSAHSLIRALYWRDFFSHIAWHFPYVFEGAFHKDLNRIEWPNPPVLFRAWCDGRTGFPMVDAAMRELNATGYMQNRMRMIVASFLVKDCGVDWRWGEKYFAQHLVDYDPALNNGNWQWVAGTGCDAQPYFRMFNPWLAQKKFDSEGLYVKRWLPELAKVAPKVLYQLPHYYNSLITNYPQPIVDHEAQRKKIKTLYLK